MTISQLVRVPQSCTEQLQHPEINRANPRTASITTLIPFGYANFDLITGRAVTRAASFGLAETSRGRALRGSGAACASIVLDLSAYQLITLSFWMYWDAFASDDDLAMEFSPNYNTGGGFLIDPNSGAPAMGYFQVGTGGTISGSSRYFTRPSAAAWHHYMMVLDKAAASTGGVTAAFVDGSAVSLTTASNSGTTANFPNSTLYLFSRNNTGLFGNGSLLNLVIRGGYMGTADDALAEYTDPWGLFEAPQVPEIWVPVSAGGGSASTGEVTATLGALTSTATGSVALNGATSATLAALTSTATGSLTVNATASPTLAALTSSATGSLSLNAALSATLANVTLAATAAVGNDINGELAATLGDATLVATGSVDIAATLGVTLGDLALSGASSLSLNASASATLASLSITATATVGDSDVWVVSAPPVGRKISSDRRATQSSASRPSNSSSRIR